MKNYKGPAEILGLTAPAGGVTSGTPLIVGDLFVVPQITAAAGASFSAVLVGVVEIDAKTTDTASDGDEAFWDDGNSEATVTPTGNRRIGFFETAKTNGQTVARICLDGKTGPARYSVTFDPASVAANISAEQTVTVTGLAVGDQVHVTPPALTAGLVFSHARVSAADTLAITLANVTAGALDEGSGTWEVTVL